MALILATFEDYSEFVNALRNLKDSGAAEYEAYGPTNLREIEELMPAQSSFVRGWASLGGVFGLALFWVTCILSALLYNLVVGGKPPISNVPYIIPAYEGTILLGSISAFLAGLAYAVLIPRYPPKSYDVRFSEDVYGIEVKCEADDRAGVVDLLTRAGASEVKEV